ncbi:MAG: amidohydrolase family protein [Armatimonadetes bacterium]|nr:amidohydrolase family protein [Armatimonadota bacterium]
MMDLTAIPLYDHHCHALRRPGAALDGAAFRRHFGESRDPAMAAHQSSGLFYGRSLRDLAALLGCAPEEDSVLAARHRQPPEAHARRLLDAAHVVALLVDTGFRGAENYTLTEQREFLPCPIHEALRLETLAERLIAEAANFDEVEDAFRAALADVRARGILAFKSIIAYRGGLTVRPRTRAEAAAAFPALRERAVRDGRVRLTSRPVLEYLLRVGLEAAAVQELPVQFHTGLGDADLDLRRANPLRLRPLLEEAAWRGVPFVLLHCYPFVREAGYLASIYGNVFLDLSLTIPFTAHGGEAAVRAALELAPTSKVLLGTDAFSIPELFYLGALHAREGLARALTRLTAEGWLTPGQAERAARQMLCENAAALYGG